MSIFISKKRGALGAPFALGVDGGGSGCRAVLTEAAGRVRAKATGGPANMTSDAVGALGNLRALVGDVLGDLPQGDVTAHFGLAGVLNPCTGDRVAEAFEFANCTVSDDRACFVVGALGDRDGVLLALGTGSIMAAQFGGVMRGINGWGWQLSDHGAGAWLGRMMLERVLLCHDGLFPPSELTKRLLSEMGGPTGIVDFAATAKAPDYAAIAPHILGSEDANARDVMTAGAALLSRAIHVLDPQGVGDVCLAGGIGPYYAPFLAQDVQARIVPPQGNALDGALRFARKAVSGG